MEMAPIDSNRLGLPFPSNQALLKGSTHYLSFLFPLIRHPLPGTKRESSMPQISGYRNICLGGLVGAHVFLNSSWWRAGV